MTTIAYKNGVIAYDSMVCSGDNISSLNFDKHMQDANGDNYFFAGSVADYQDFIDRKGNADCSAIVESKGEVRVMACNSEDGYFNMIKSDYYAIGSGYRIALGAMDAGCSAKQAVKIAKKRDLNTGGKIRTFKVNPAYAK